MQRTTCDPQRTFATQTMQHATYKHAPNSIVCHACTTRRARHKGPSVVTTCSRRWHRCRCWCRRRRCGSASAVACVHRLKLLRGGRRRRRRRRRVRALPMRERLVVPRHLSRARLRASERAIYRTGVQRRGCERHSAPPASLALSSRMAAQPRPHVVLCAGSEAGTGALTHSGCAATAHQSMNSA